MVVFSNEYSSETLIDLDSDLVAMYDNRQFEEIPVDDCGFHKGKFTVTVVWEAE